MSGIRNLVSEFFSHWLSSLWSPFLLGTYVSVFISWFSCSLQRLYGQFRDTGLGDSSLTVLSQIQQVNANIECPYSEGQILLAIPKAGLPCFCLQNSFLFAVVVYGSQQEGGWRLWFQRYLRIFLLPSFPKSCQRQDPQKYMGPCVLSSLPR